jgi:hypothetical protein
MEVRWEPILAVDRAWYLTVIPEIQKWMEELERQPTSVRDQCQDELYGFFAKHLSNGGIALGTSCGYFDKDRKSIDTIVLHHTSNQPGLSQDRLSAIELIRLYAPYFLSPEANDMHLKGKAIFSGHEREGIQVFWPYHWIVRRDGAVERLLNDREIGWHAGNWDINCRSVGIALDNDYEWSCPSKTELLAVAKLIRRHYGAVVHGRLFGHREITSKTTCPSQFFLETSTGQGWKTALLATLR